MTHKGWLGAVAAVAAAAVLGTPAALASPELDFNARGEAEVEVQSGEGIPAGIPPALLRKSFAALKASAPGRKYLETPNGRKYAGDVARALRGRGEKARATYFAGPGPDMCEGCWPDYDSFNDASDTYGEAGGADGYGYFGGCKNPYIVAKHRNVFGVDLWHYYQQLVFCWQGGGITYVYRTRWAWVNDHWLNGWSFHGHISTNCYTETCQGHWIGADWARYWTQGKFEVCGLWRFGCRARHPLVGIDVNGWGGWYGWMIK